MKFDSAIVREKWYKVVADLNNPKMTADNPYFESKYVPLHEALKHLRGRFLEAGFIISQECGYELGMARVKTQFIGEDGIAESEWCGCECKKDPQGTASALTYLKRIQLLSITGLVGENDDDGNEGTGKKTELDIKLEKCKTQADLTKLYQTLSKEEKEQHKEKFTKRKNEIG